MFDAFLPRIVNKFNVLDILAIKIIKVKFIIFRDLKPGRRRS